MSEPPPGPPGGPPPGWSPYPQQPPRSGMSNTAKFWIGVLLALPVVVVGSIVVGIASGIGSALDDIGHGVGDPGRPSRASSTWPHSSPPWSLSRTRWFALGVIAGIAVLAVLAAGACVVLLAAFSSSYGCILDSADPPPGMGRWVGCDRTQ